MPSYITMGIVWVLVYPVCPGLVACFPSRMLYWSHTCYTGYNTANSTGHMNITLVTYT